MLVGVTCPPHQILRVIIRRPHMSTSYQLQVSRAGRTITSTDCQTHHAIYRPFRLEALLKISSTSLRLSRFSSGLLLALCLSPKSSLGTERRSTLSSRPLTLSVVPLLRTEPSDIGRPASGLVE